MPVSSGGGVNSLRVRGGKKYFSARRALYHPHQSHEHFVLSPALIKRPRRPVNHNDRHLRSQGKIGDGTVNSLKHEWPYCQMSTSRHWTPPLTTFAMLFQLFVLFSAYRSRIFNVERYRQRFQTFQALTLTRFHCHAINSPYPRSPCWGRSGTGYGYASVKTVYLQVGNFLQIGISRWK